MGDVTHETQFRDNQTGSGEPITVLLVDDQRFIGLALERLLVTEADITLHCCEAAHEAVTRANAIRPTIILQDLVMPGINGLELVGRFRENPATARTPIIVLSANEETGNRASSLAAGANDYLLKLPPKDELIGCIRAHAARRNRLESAVPSPPPQPVCSSESVDSGMMALFRDQNGELTAFARALIIQFTRDAEAQVVTLKDAARSHNDELLRATAHSLKGSSLTMGATRLGGLCRQLEVDTESEWPALVAALDEEFALVRKALAEL